MVFKLATPAGRPEVSWAKLKAVAQGSALGSRCPGPDSTHIQSRLQALKARNDRNIRTAASAWQTRDMPHGNELKLATHQAKFS